MSVDVHHGDDWRRDTTTYTHREAPIRSYVPTCRTFLDVITTGQGRRCLHVRARPRDTYRGRSRCVKVASPGGAEHASADHGVYTWPSELLKREKQLTALQYNPDTATQPLEWYGDEKFVVYALQSMVPESRRRIAIISFDPSAQVVIAETLLRPPSHTRMAFNET